MTSKVFTRDELAAAFQTFEATVDRAARTRDWDLWVEQYAPDVTYVEHAAWIWQTMETFPGNYMTSTPGGWLRDPAPLLHANVEGTGNALAIALAGLHRFVYTSSYVTTVGRKRGGCPPRGLAAVGRAEGCASWVGSRGPVEESIREAEVLGGPAGAVRRAGKTG